ncbi:hypothetical protein GZH47_19830 [Paenibacillus rhizovicinus]|uniref:Uncharacterized protein n=1 Tax=Paenibacillus rhizovicinus TaxID=2704463 RepID=A0A6C0P2Y5_9BACL|nr:hypothetical protein [Paenibacillus rhizovicinus]QHW32837.1 hypothetical protein GZH47_19830 [Paenibacillus rhizovicinus]
MIVHYTRDINSAASILSSKELWLNRVGLMSDQNDILFYLNEFNRLHYTQDLIATFKQALKLMSQTPNLNQKQFFTHTFLAAQLRKVAYQNGVSLGGSLANLLKQHSFMTSFNEEEASTFTNPANGDIAFEFESNPLAAPHGFQLLFNKVHYADSDKVKKLQANSGDDMTQFMESVAQENNSTFTDILAAYITKLEKQQLAYTNAVHDAIAGLMEDNRVSEAAFTPLDLYSKRDTVDMVTFIHGYIVEEFTTTFRKETGQKPPTKLEIKQTLKQNPEMIHATWIDLRSILIKDDASQQENEVRAILLPQNKKLFNQQKKHLPLAFQTDKLRRIVISPNCEHKAEWKAKLEDALITNKYANVVVEIGQQAIMNT